jgi:hypothetical protein
MILGKLPPSPTTPTSDSKARDSRTNLLNRLFGFCRSSLPTVVVAPELWLSSELFALPVWGLWWWCWEDELKGDEGDVAKDDRMGD